MNKEVIAGIIFLLFWIFAMAWFGMARDIRPDLRNEDIYGQTRGVGHPLYQDY